VKRGDAWARIALSALISTGLAACRLDSGGLLDVDAAGDDGTTADEGGDDVSPADGTAGTDDGGQPDRHDEASAETGADGGTNPPADAAPDAGAVVADARHDSSSDARPDAPADALASDAPADSVADAPADGVAPIDAPADTGPLPIVWDGGSIADPQFYDGDWVNFCVALVACGAMPNVSACVGLLHQPSSLDALIPSLDIVDAVDNVQPNCRQVKRALGGGVACASVTADTCAGDSLTTCRFGFTMTIDCGALGMVCSNGSGNAGCGFGDCAASQEGETYCVGPNNLAKCTAGRYEPLLDCQTFGGKCIGPAGGAQCQGTGGMACHGGASCAGNSLVECLGGLPGSIDCTARYDPSFTCLVDDAGLPRCARGTSCDPSVAVDTCLQTQLTFCNAGTSDTFDCAVNGYSGCDGGKCFP